MGLIPINYARRAQTCVVCALRCTNRISHLCNLNLPKTLYKLYVYTHTTHDGMCMCHCENRGSYVRECMRECVSVCPCVNTLTHVHTIHTPLSTPRHIIMFGREVRGTVLRMVLESVYARRTLWVRFDKTLAHIY